ncbi:Sensory transduction protein LytR [Flavobacteriales bacterium]|nr:Sensory transduction protein LytR [Flavobacteriales bacterium]
MEYKAIIADDEKGALNSLQSMLQNYCPQLEVVATANSVDSAYNEIEKHQPNIVFLDIEMGKNTAFDLLEKIKNTSFDIIFTTAYDHYAIKAIRFSALDYLLKPIDPDELKESVQKFILKKHDENLINSKLKTLLGNLNQENKNKKIAISDSDGLVFLNVNEIVRCHSDGSYTTIYLSDGKKMVVSKPIGEYEELLNEENFFRVHRSHLINLNHIKKYIKGEGGYVLMADGAEVEISRRKKNEFVEIMLNKK